MRANTEQKISQMREAAISTAVRLIETEGEEAATARVIAKALGTSVGTLYNRFGDLDELLLHAHATIYDEFAKVVTQRIQESIDGGASAKEQMTVLALTYLDFTIAHQARWSAMISFNRRHKSPPPPWYVMKAVGLMRIIESTLDGYAALNDPMDRNRYARTLWASVHGITVACVANGYFLQPREEAEAQIHTIIKVADHYLLTKAGQA